MRFFRAAAGLPPGLSLNPCEEVMRSASFH